MNDDFNIGNIGCITAFGIVCVVIFALVLFCVCEGATIVRPGTVGIPVRLGKVLDTVLEEGFHVVNPFTTDVEHIDVKTQLLSVSANAATKDLQDVESTVAVNLSVDRKQAGVLFKTVGRDYAERIIQPVVMETFKSQAATYTAEELITKRSELSQKLITSLTDALEKRGIIVEGVSLTQFNFSSEFNAAIEKKIIAEQEALQAKNELEKTKVEAQKTEEVAKGKALAKKAEADGEAEAIRIKATAEAEANKQIAESLQGTNVLWYQAIQKWDGKTPTHVLGSPVPVVDVK